MARPTLYTPAIGDRICGEIAHGRAMETLCRNDETLPTARTVYSWLREHKEFLQNYEISKSDQADFLAAEILEIADDPKIESADKRIRVDARKWLASKFKPKKYGDRTILEATVNDYASMSPDERRQRIAVLQQALRDADSGI